MRILWHSNAPWNGSGYGIETAIFVPRIASLGHEVIISAPYSFGGNVLEWEGFQVLPCVRDPAGNAVLRDAILLDDGAVATSGSYEVFFDAARRFHHLVDPRTGRSPAHCVSVSVRAPTAMAADALATSVFCMPPGAGMELVERLPACACLIIDAAGRRIRSRGWTSAHPSHQEAAQA